MSATMTQQMADMIALGMREDSATADAGNRAYFALQDGTAAAEQALKAVVAAGYASATQYAESIVVTATDSGRAARAAAVKSGEVKA